MIRTCGTGHDNAARADRGRGLCRGSALAPLLTPEHWLAELSPAITATEGCSATAVVESVRW